MRRTRAATATALALTVAAAAAHAELDCVTSGYDILLTNLGPETAEAGQPVAWEVRFVRKSGRLELESPLAPGDTVFVSGALGSDYLSAPQPCTARLD